MAAILVGSRDHRTQIWKGAIQGSFHKSLVAIGPVVSEEKSEMLTDGRRTKSDDNSSHGQLKNILNYDSRNHWVEMYINMFLTVIKPQLMSSCKTGSSIRLRGFLWYDFLYSVMYKMQCIFFGLLSLNVYFYIPLVDIKLIEDNKRFDPRRMKSFTVNSCLTLV